MCGVDDRAMFRILGMEMWRRVFVEEHADDDAEKAADDGHVNSFRIAGQTSNQPP
jgi:hypothetical protein